MSTITAELVSGQTAVVGIASSREAYEIEVSSGVAGADGIGVVAANIVGGMLNLTLSNSAVINAGSVVGVPPTGTITFTGDVIGEFSNGSVGIQGGNNVWTFGSNGALSFPDGTVQTTAFTGLGNLSATTDHMTIRSTTVKLDNGANTWNGSIGGMANVVGFQGSNNTLLTMSGNGASVMSLQTDGSIFAGDTYGDPAPLGVSGSYGGWIVAMSGIKSAYSVQAGSDVNASGELQTGTGVRFPDGSLQTTASAGNAQTDRLVSGNTTAVLQSNGAVVFDNGAAIVPSNDGIDLVAQAGGWAELASNNAANYVWVDDSGVFIGTNWNTDSKQWTFSSNGSLLFAGYTLDGSWASPPSYVDGPYVSRAAIHLPSGVGYDKTISLYNSHVGGQGISFTTTANGEVSTNHTWNLTNDGRLEFPNHTFQTTAWTGSIDHLVSNGYAVTLQSDGVLSLPGNTATITGNTNYVSIWANNSTNDGIEIGAGDYLDVASQGAVHIITNTGGGYTKLWAFSNTGGLTFPDNTTQTTAYTGLGDLAISNTTIAVTNNTSNASLTVQVNCDDPSASPPFSGIRTFIFGADGGLTFPDNTTQYTAWPDNITFDQINGGVLRITTFSSATNAIHEIDMNGGGNTGVLYYDLAANVMRGYANGWLTFVTTDSIASLTSNNAVYLDGVAANQYAYANQIPTTLASLSDVNITGSITAGYVLKWDGTKWAPGVDATTGGGGTDADTLDGQHGGYYLDYNNLTNTPNLSVYATTTDLSSNLANYATTSSLSGYVTTSQLSGNLSSYATQTYVSTQINSLINAAPGTLDTLGEIATALQNDESALGALTTTVSGKISLANLSVTTGTGTTGGSLSYDNTTGVFTYRPSNYAYTLPQANTTVLGGVKVDGNTIAINASSGVIYTTQNLSNTGSVTFANTTVTNNLTVSNTIFASAINETFSTYSTAITGSPTVTFDCTVSNIWNITSTISSNWTANFTNLGLSNGYTTSTTMIVNQGATGYIPSALQIESANVAINWQGGTAPTGSANKKDVFAFSVMQTGANTYMAFGQMVTFG